MNSKQVGFLIIAVILLGGLFFFLKPKSSGQTAAVDTVPQVKTFEILVKNRKIVSGSDTLQVNEGDNVVIKITVDEPEELHLHGYDKSVDLEKDVQGELPFTASLTGRFPFELENSKTDLGILEVQPKQ